MRHSLLVPLCFVAACTSEPQTASAGPISLKMANTVRVASYNMNFGVAGDPQPGVEAIERTNADIVLLQETNPAWERAIVAATGARYTEHRFGDPPSNYMAAGGMGVLSRFPIVSLDKLEPTDGGLFFAYRVVIDAPSGRLQLLDVHLRPPMDDRGSWVKGYFSTRAGRGKELARHLADLDPNLPTIVAGDFNEDAAVGAAIAELAKRGYTDAVAQFHGTDHTWRWPIPGGELQFQLDHIFYDARLAASTSTIVDAGHSDHLPIVADITLRQRSFPSSAAQ